MICRHTPTSRRRRIEEVAQTRLVEKFSRSSNSVDEHQRQHSTAPGSDASEPTVTRDGGTVSIQANGTTLDVLVDAVESLRQDLDGALSEERSFLHTAGQHRRDGSYVVQRRGADSSGNSKVFESFDTLERLANRLPEAVTAEDLSQVGLTGARRHMVLWHLVEHPALPFELTKRQPLTATRGDGE